MRIELPSGAWVDVKDNAVPGDRFAIQDAVELEVEDGGRRVVRGAAGKQWKAFLARFVTGWSFPVPIPAVVGTDVLDDWPDQEEDDEALQDALQERFDRVTRVRPTAPRKPSPTKETSASS
jgi:hypothetical protein